MVPQMPAGRVLQAALRFSDYAANMDKPGTWDSFTCAEIEALADVLRAVEKTDAADMIVALHQQSDDICKKGRYHTHNRQRR